METLRLNKPTEELDPRIAAIDRLVAAGDRARNFLDSLPNGTNKFAKMDSLEVLKLIRTNQI